MNLGTRLQHPASNQRQLDVPNSRMCAPASVIYLGNPFAYELHLFGGFFVHPS